MDIDAKVKAAWEAGFNSGLSVGPRDGAETERRYAWAKFIGKPLREGTATLTTLGEVSGGMLKDFKRYLK